MKRIFKIREFVILLAVIITAGVFYFAQPGEGNRFLSLSNLEAVLMGMSLDGLIAIGMTFVIITGGFDLSVGSTFAFGGLIVGVLLQSGVSTPVAFVAALLAGALVGMFNGFFITKVKVNPFVTTLGSMTIVRGIVLLATQGNSITGFPDGFLVIGQDKLFGVFYPILIMLFFLLISDFLLRKSRFLRKTYCIGGNEEAARLSGIDVDRVKVWMYISHGHALGACRRDRHRQDRSDLSHCRERCRVTDHCGGCRRRCQPFGRTRYDLWNVLGAHAHQHHYERVGVPADFILHGRDRFGHHPDHRRHARPIDS